MPALDFGSQLREWRLAAGYGLRRFAKLIGELPSNLSSIETGQRPPWRASEKLRKVAEALAFEEGSREWDRFFLSARKDGALPPDLDRLLGRELHLSLLRTVDEKQLNDEELLALVQFIREDKFRDKKRPRNRKTS